MRRSYDLDDETAHRLDCIAIAHGIRKTDVIKIVINLYFENEEPSFGTQIRKRVAATARKFRDLPRY